MRKKWTVLLSTIIALSTLSACGGNNKNESSNEGENKATKQYITNFDGYNQCILFPAVAWDTTLHAGGNVINDWNTDMGYVSEGTGSIKVNAYKPAENGAYWYKGRIEANNGFVSSITDINGAKKISLDICNPGETAIEVTLEIESASQAMVSVSKICEPMQWTTVSTAIEAGDYDIVNWYSITLRNTQTDESFTVFMDNFYLEF